MLAVELNHRLSDFELDCNFASSARVTGLFGPSGAGKTTLLRILAGLLVPDSGRVSLAGRCVFDSAQGINVPPHKRRIGYVFQQANLFTHLNVRHNLTYGAWFTRRRSPNAQPHFNHVVDMLEIGALLDRRIARLSGGERQRVAIGRALLADPAVLLLDEPLASLDAARKQEVLPYIERLSAEFDLPIVFVSHQLDELLRLANRHVIALDRGTVAYSGPTAEFLTRPELLGAGHFRDAGALLRVAVDAHRRDYGLSVLDCDGQSLYVPHLPQQVGENVTLHVRSSDVMLARERPSEISALNVLSTTIEAIEADGNHAVNVRLRAGSRALTAHVTRLSCDRLQLVPGEPVYAVIKSLALAEQAWQRQYAL